MEKTTKHKHIIDPDIEIKTRLIVVSDSLSSLSPQERKNRDKSSFIAKGLLEEKKHIHIETLYVPDEEEEIQDQLKYSLEQNFNLAIFIGGTGIGRRDVTIEAVKPALEKELQGFGELFRYLTYKEVGTVSIMTRALAGVIGKSVVVCLPGSPNAVKLGINLILQELIHILNLRS
ncbi:MAG: MogA/MoaB family molybdenum cofactor biosynthesis protein [Candidatus Heimdallarchaeaceae archaeon]